MQQHPFKPGQRWVSDGERDLGLGEILDSDQRVVTVAFAATGIQRQYAVAQAPLTRIVFSPGDQIQNQQGESVFVRDVVENDGFLIYDCENEAGEKVLLPETQIHSAMQFSRPQDRLFSGGIDPDKWFQLRKQTLAIKSRLQQSPVQGLIGGRVDLIPHQLYIAAEVGQRHAPRVLLADEVGLGKTIEAGLILHRQLATEQISRVLIVLPDALVHQWLVEMLRRFNLKFSVFDEERCLETPEQNPFESSQLIIASLGFFMANEIRREQALEAGWDMLIVDEAHHLHWSESGVSEEYRFVEQLAATTPSLLLLTATPEQLGVSSHFARLRLLDPARFPDLAEFVEEENNYEPVARAASALIDNKPLTRQQVDWLTRALPDYESSIKSLMRTQDNTETRDEVIQALLDRHGAGRVLFRNTRDVIRGFPPRHFFLHRLNQPEQYAALSNSLQPETHWRESGQSEPWTDFDPRTRWLTEFLQQNPGNKVLVICANADTAIELEQHLRVRHAIHSAVFHESLSMVARDRAAAWFGDPEEGAQCLICSEIGSEGRNFQFSHHLVLFDLPLNPDLLEQRIGRLDRIGQKHPIHIHAPVLENSAQDELARWYHEGLNAFEKTCPTGASVFGEVEADLRAVLQGGGDRNRLLEKTRTLDKTMRERLQAGRDKLLELSSCRPDVGNEIIHQIHKQEDPDEIVGFLEQVCDCYNVKLRDHATDSYLIRPGDHMRTAHFPGLNEQGFVFTPKRELSVSREDLQFMTWEHPLINGAIDLILSDETGNSAFAIVDSHLLPTGTVLVETIHVLDITAPPELALHRFLPTTAFHVLTTPDGEDYSELLNEDVLPRIPEKIPTELMKTFIKNNQSNIKAAIAASASVAEKQAKESIEGALKKAQGMLDYEFRRLTELRRRNAFIRQDEIDFVAEQNKLLTGLIESAGARLDAVRVILTRQKTP